MRLRGAATIHTELTEKAEKAEKAQLLDPCSPQGHRAFQTPDPSETSVVSV
jgi:hypothetical protein